MNDALTQLVVNFGGLGLLGVISFFLIKFLMAKYDQLLQATLAHLASLTTTIENHLETLVQEEKEVCRHLKALAAALEAHNREMDEFHKDLEKRLAGR